MRRDEETGTIIAAKDIKEEGLCGDGDTAASGEPGAGEISGGESSRVGKSREHQ